MNLQQEIATTKVHQSITTAFSGTFSQLDKIICAVVMTKKWSFH